MAPSDHGAISHPSYLRPDKARIAQAHVLAELASKGAITESSPATPELAGRMRAALLESKHTTQEVVELLKAQS